MSAVFSMRGLTPTDRLILLAYANYADHEGRGARPSVPTVAINCEVSERTVQRTLKRLTEAGYLILESRVGRADRAVNSYRIDLTGCQSVTPSQVHGVTRVSPDPEIDLLLRDPDPDLIDLGSSGSGDTTGACVSPRVEAKAIYTDLASSLGVFSPPLGWAESWLATRTPVEITAAIGKAREAGAKSTRYVDKILESPPKPSRRPDPPWRGWKPGMSPPAGESLVDPYAHLIHTGLE